SVDLLPPVHSMEENEFNWTFSETGGSEETVIRESKLANPVVTFLDTSMQSYRVDVRVTPIANPDSMFSNSTLFQLIPEAPVVLSVSPDAGITCNTVAFPVDLDNPADPGIYAYEWDFSEIGTTQGSTDANPLVLLGDADEIPMSGNVKVYTRDHREQ